MPLARTTLARTTRRTVLAVALAVGLTACTIASPASSGSSSTVVSASSSALIAPAPGATIVVTVPQLGGAAASAPASAALTSAPAVAPSKGSVSSASSSAPASQGATTAPTSPTVTPSASPTKQAPVTLTSTQAPPSTSIQAPPPTSAAATMTVKLANCPGCTVLATHAAVTSAYGAALVATSQGRAALLALRSDGSVAGAANVTYGTTFPTPPGGELGCDAAGRCIVIAQQADGTAIASAYQVNGQGAWADVTGQPGITSVTAQARTLTVGGNIGVAVQDQADGSTVWIVYSWDGEGYTVKGCTAAATPDPNALAMSSCLS